MRYSAKEYAKALAGIIVSPPARKNTNQVAKAFLQILRKNKDLKKVKEILALAEMLALKKKGSRKIIIETARSIGIKNLRGSFAKQGDAMEEKINPKMIAGVKITVNHEIQIDFSLKKKLEEMFTWPTKF